MEVELENGTRTTMKIIKDQFKRNSERRKMSCIGFSYPYIPMTFSSFSILQFTNKQHEHNIHTVNKRIDEPKIQKWKGNEWTQRWGYSLSVCYISSFDNVWLIMNDMDVAVEHSRHRLLFPWLSHGGACIIYHPLHGKNIWAQNSQQSRFHNYPFFSFKNMIVLK